MVGLNSLHRKAWEISQREETEEKTKVQALSLARDCVINKIDLFTNTTVMDDAMRFVLSNKFKDCKIIQDNGRQNRRLKK